jgi:hypothetical protein
MLFFQSNEILFYIYTAKLGELVPSLGFEDLTVVVKKSCLLEYNAVWSTENQQIFREEHVEK